jgi:hypothetical protein
MIGAATTIAGIVLSIYVILTRNKHVFTGLRGKITPLDLKRRMR